MFSFLINVKHNFFHIKSKMKFIVLDIDETMIHSFNGIKGYDAARQKKSLEGRVHHFKLDGREFWWFIERPYLREFLAALAPYYNIGVWSAGDYDYVHAIVEKIFTTIKPIFIFTRDDCDHLLEGDTKGLHVSASLKKPLFNIWQAQPQLNRKNTIIIDDRCDVCELNAMNHLHIPAYDFDRNNPDETDQVLPRLAAHLIKHKDVPDVRFITSIEL